MASRVMKVELLTIATAFLLIVATAQGHLQRGSQFTGGVQVASDELNECNETNRGTIAFLNGDSILRYCNSSAWVEVRPLQTEDLRNLVLCNGHGIAQTNNTCACYSDTERGYYNPPSCQTCFGAFAKNPYTGLCTDIAPCSPISIEQQDNEYFTSAQEDPSVCVLSHGGWVILYETSGFDGNGDGIAGRVYSSDGTAMGGEFAVAQLTTSNQIDPVCIGLRGGGFVAVWSSLYDSSKYQVQARMFDGSGSAVGGEFRVEASDNGYTRNQAARTALADGGFLVSWSDSAADGSSTGIFAQRFSSSGAYVGGAIQVNQWTTSTQAEVSVTTLWNGDVVFSWYSSSQDGADTGVFHRRFDGSTLLPLDSSDVQVNVFTTGSQQTPDVAWLDDGGYVVVWQSTNIDADGSWGVFGRVYDDNGVSSMSSEFELATFTTNTQIRPVVAATVDHGAGRFVALWYSSGQVTDESYGTYAQWFESSGVLVENEFHVNDYTSGNQLFPAVASLLNGGFVVSFESAGPDGSGDGVFYKVYC